MVHLRFEIAGQVQLSRALEGIADDIGDWTPAFEEMAEDFYGRQRSVFNAQGSYEGLSRWKRLSPKYAEWKNRHFPGRKILVLTGRLKSSLTTDSGEGSIKLISEKEMSIGSYLPVGRKRWNLAMLHQLGTRKMPARPPMRLTEPQRSEWVGILHRYLWQDRIAEHMERNLNQRNFDLKVRREP